MSSSTDPAASSYLSSQALPDSTPAGATAQTGGFVEASNPTDHHAPAPGSNNPFIHDPVSSLAATGQGFGGGLQSSPLVPAPGTTINPATGKLHSAGMTRAELEAKRAKEAESVEEAKIGGGGGSGAADPGAEKLRELSGREQAARQLAANLQTAPVPVLVAATSSAPSNVAPAPAVIVSTASALPDISVAPADSNSTATHASVPATSSHVPPATTSLSTPSRPAVGERTASKHMPGAFGSVPQVPVPGAPGSNTTSIYEDVNETLAKVGAATFAALPTSLKNALSASPTLPEHRTGLSPDAPGSPTAGRRSSVAAVFENVKNQANSLVAEVRDTYAHPGAHLGTGTGANQTNPTGRRLSAALTGEGGALNKVKDFLAEAWVPPHLSQTHPVASGLAAPRVSLPSQETSGAKPGEYSSGVGALPGKSTETGVAVLPEEKAQSSGSALQNQAFRPGEVPVAPSSLPNEASGSGPDLQGDVKAEDTGAPLEKAPEVIPAPAAIDHDSTSASHDGGLSKSVAGLSLASPHTSAESRETPVTAPQSEDTGAPLAKAPEVIPAPPADEHHSHTADSTSAPKYNHDESIYPTASTGATQPTTSQAPITTFGSVDETKPAHSSSTSTSSGAFGGLAPALPATFLGKGADQGATDVSAIKGVFSDKTAQVPTSEDITSSQSTAPSSLASSSVTGADHSSAPAPAIDRTTSLASVTAIRHGHEGDRSGPHSSPLATIDDESTDVKSPSTGTGGGFTSAQSLTPGHESHGVGHPSSRGQDGTSREPGSYPIAEHGDLDSNSAPSATATPNNNEGKTAEFASGIPVIKDELSTAVHNAKPASSATPPTGATIAPSSTSAAGSHAPALPPKSPHAATGGATSGSGHARTSSTSSSNGGKKKSGFMSKLKEKLKHHE